MDLQTPKRRMLEIALVDVPISLYGVPLFFEIYPPRGSPINKAIIVQPDLVTTLELPTDGLFTIRAQLPSGDYVADHVTIGTHRNAKTAMLNFSLSGNAISASQQDLYSGAHTSALKRFSNFLNQDRTSVTFAGTDDIDLIDEKFAVTYSLIAWNDWLPDRRGASVRAILPPQTSIFPGELKFVEREIISTEMTSWKPLLIKATIRAAVSGEKICDLLTWPPSIPLRYIVLKVMRHDAFNPITMPISAEMSTGDNAIDALFAYMRGGFLDVVRQSVPLLSQKCESLLWAKEEQPVFAILGAYVLLRVSQKINQRWISNLAERFPNLPDGQILMGWQHIKNGNLEDARRSFASAIQRGIPLFAEGVRKLRDGTNYIFGLDNDAKAEADVASQLAALTSFNSELTCITLSQDFRLQQ